MRIRSFFRRSLILSALCLSAGLSGCYDGDDDGERISIPDPTTEILMPATRAANDPNYPNTILDTKNCEGRSYVIDLEIPFKTKTAESADPIPAVCECARPGFGAKFGWLLSLVLHPSDTVKGTKNQLVCVNYNGEYSYKVSSSELSGMTDQEKEDYIQRTKQQSEDSCWAQYDQLRTRVLDDIASTMPTNTLSASVRTEFLTRYSDEERKANPNLPAYHEHLQFTLPVCAYPALEQKLRNIHTGDTVWVDPVLHVLGYDDGHEARACSGQSVTPELVYTSPLAAMDAAEFVANVEKSNIAGVSSSASFVLQSASDISHVVDTFKPYIAVSVFEKEILDALKDFDYQNKTAVLLIGPVMQFPEKKGIYIVDGSTLERDITLSMDPVCAGTTALETRFTIGCAVSDETREREDEILKQIRAGRNQGYGQMGKTWPLAIYALPKGDYTVASGRHYDYSCAE